jgi:hypothetical protein
MPQNEHLLPRNNGNPKPLRVFRGIFFGTEFRWKPSFSWQEMTAGICTFHCVQFVHAKESLKQNISIHKNALKKFSLQTKCLHEINYLLSLSKALVAIIVSTKSLPPPYTNGGTGLGSSSAGGCRATFSLRPNSSESEN